MRAGQKHWSSYRCQMMSMPAMADGSANDRHLQSSYDDSSNVSNSSIDDTMNTSTMVNTTMVTTTTSTTTSTTSTIVA